MQRIALLVSFLQDKHIADFGVLSQLMIILWLEVLGICSDFFTFLSSVIQERSQSPVSLHMHGLWTPGGRPDYLLIFFKAFITSFHGSVQHSITKDFPRKLKYVMSW